MPRFHGPFQIIGKGGIAREIAAYYYAKEKIQPAILGEFAEIDLYKPHFNTVIAIGSGEVRKIMANKYEYNYVSVCFGKDFSGGNNVIGAGTVVCPGSILTVGITLGRHVLVNLNCTIGHDTVIGDFTTVSPGANISGNVTIGECCYIGTNAVIREKINICSNVTLGAGAVVVKDITEPGVYVGNPVKKIK